MSDSEKSSTFLELVKSALLPFDYDLLVDATDELREDFHQTSWLQFLYRTCWVWVQLSTTLAMVFVLLAFVESPSMFEIFGKFGIYSILILGVVSMIGLSRFHLTLISKINEGTSIIEDDEHHSVRLKLIFQFVFGFIFLVIPSLVIAEAGFPIHDLLIRLIVYPMLLGFLIAGFTLLISLVIDIRNAF